VPSGRGHAAGGRGGRQRGKGSIAVMHGHADEVQGAFAWVIRTSAQDGPSEGHSSRKEAQVG